MSSLLVLDSLPWAWGSLKMRTTQIATRAVIARVATNATPKIRPALLHFLFYSLDVFLEYEFLSTLVTESLATSLLSLEGLAEKVGFWYILKVYLVCLAAEIELNDAAAYRVTRYGTPLHHTLYSGKFSRSAYFLVFRGCSLLRDITLQTLFFSIDATNAFNSLNSQTALYNIRRFCPALATILINTYRVPTELFIDEDRMLSREGTTQGDPLAMPMYALATVPLINRLSNGGIRQ